ncbi:unnamed protein product [Paramecium octaurelia]|uniref:Aspartate transaminase n=1 Tax=Paramecium octaurelia TaxID=43137 RepID=A0A8S1US17_PAROT|nr:unnamed protein product [Paramecium octaurelia]
MNAYKADPYDKKIDLGVGTYGTDEEKPQIFEVVKRVDQRLSMSYFELSRNICYLKTYLTLTRAVKGDYLAKTTPLIESGRIVTAQCLG